jgi:uncharacterized membrane protein YfcA
MSSITQASVLAAAGVLAGAVGSAGGITSLVSYTALLAVGVPARPADVANLVASVATWPGSALTSRRELADVRAFLARGLPVVAGGAAAGAVLLLVTPPGVFSQVVPFLIAAGSLALLAQPWLTARFGQQHRRSTRFALPLVGLISIYLGYFGAGSGILLLTLLLVLVDQRLPESNAAKNMLVGAGSVASAVVFVLAGPVDWAAVAPLAIGLFFGSMIGPIITRRVRPSVVRLVVAALGIALAVDLWVT